MIIKSSQRAGAKALALHLTKSIDSDGVEQTVILGSSRHILPAQDVQAALQDMDMLAWASPTTKKHLYHVSINPDQDLDLQQWDKAWAIYEQEFGLTDHPYMEVVHVKKDRAHIHRAYERVDTDGKAIQLSWTRIRNEKVARVLEYEFGHPLTIGKHNRAVMLRLHEEGKDQIVTWMGQQQAHKVERPVAAMDYQDHQQQRRTKISKPQVKQILKQAYSESDTGQGFIELIRAHHLHLAQGNRRDFVVVDAQGGTHSPRRMLGVKVKELRARWSDLTPQDLPTVEQVQQTQTSSQSTDQPKNKLIKINKADPIAASVQLHAHKRQVDQDIARIEAQLPQQVVQQIRQAVTQSIAPSDPAPSQTTITPPQHHPPDQRDWLRQIQHWQRRGDPDRTKPQDAARDSSATSSWGLPPTTLAVLQTYSGNQAIAERERRVTQAVQQANSTQPNHSPAQKTALSDYLNHLGQQLKQKGKSYYRIADRWLTERLARLGYSRRQARQVLAAASPEVMQQVPSQRLTYIHRIVQWVYQAQEQRQERLQRSQQREQQPQKPTRANNTVPRSQRQLPPAKPPPTAKPQLQKDQRLLKQQQQRIEQAFQALNQPDPADYRGEATREYRRELARKMLYRHGLAITATNQGIQTDRDIAIRLYGAGFSRQHIHQAITQASPQLAGQNDAVKVQYCRKAIDPALSQPKVRQGRQQMWDWRQQHGLSYERRLDKLGLATEVASPTPPRPPSPEHSPSL